jgi:hypothetical protein
MYPLAVPGVVAGAAGQLERGADVPAGVAVAAEPSVRAGREAV